MQCGGIIGDRTGAAHYKRLLLRRRKRKRRTRTRRRVGNNIKDVRTFNKALLGKWRWDMFHHNKELWARILESKYGGWRSLLEGKRGTNESLWWQDLMTVLQENQLNNALETGSTWKVGSGDKIKFWEDCWSSNGLALMLKYPRLYQISRQQHTLIQ